MKYKFLTAVASLVLTLIFQTAQAQTAQKIPAKEAALISQKLKEAVRLDYLEGKAFLSVTIGKTEYLGAFDSGKVVKQRKAKSPTGGFYGSYAEINISYVNDDFQNSVFNENEIWKLSGGQWKQIAYKEGDYQCDNVKSVPKTVLRALKIKCID